MIWEKVWKKPSKKDLQVNNIITLRDREGNPQGKVKLLGRKPSRHKTDNLPICEFENKNEKQLDTMYLYSTERWLVEWIEHDYYRAGDKNCKDILYYMGRYTDHPSYVDINLMGNRGCPPDGVIIFIEESGVLSVDGTTYEETALKSLDRLKKAFNGEFVIYSSVPFEVRERWDIHRIKHRIYDFIHADVSFAAGIAEYIENNDISDFAVISGISRVKGQRVIQCDVTQGLRLKQ